MERPNLTAKGQVLFGLLTTAILDLDHALEHKPRPGRKRAPFTERGLNAHIKQAALSPAFRDEFQVADDVPCKTASGKRSIDYVLVDPNLSAKRPQLRAVEATCELKGPARPTIWRPTGKNYYCQIKKKNSEPFGIKPDVDKQHRRFMQAPDTEHYVFWVAEAPDQNENIDVALRRLLDRLRADLPAVRLTESSRSEIKDLWMFLFRVG